MKEFIKKYGHIINFILSVVIIVSGLMMKNLINTGLGVLFLVFSIYMYKEDKKEREEKERKALLRAEEKALKKKQNRGKKKKKKPKKRRR